MSKDSKTSLRGRDSGFGIRSTSVVAGRLRASDTGMNSPERESRPRSDVLLSFDMLLTSFELLRPPNFIHSWRTTISGAHAEQANDVPVPGQGWWHGFCGSIYTSIFN